MSIYTRTGDLGKTSLGGGIRISKSNCLIGIFGDLDEFNSLLGLVLNYAKTKEAKLILPKVQGFLLNLGAEISRSSRGTFSKISQRDVKDLEDAIDGIEKKLPQLKNFILPGGSPSGAWLHLARALCRRLERGLVQGKTSRRPIESHSLAFINRLSDFLYVLARWENLKSKSRETVWPVQKKPAA